MQTRFTRAFGVRHPIVSAPMGLISGGRLAAAVSAAGGLGLVGGGYAGLLGAEPDLHHELSLVRGQVFGIGFITWALARNPRVLDEMLDHRPACVFLSFGDAKPFAARIAAAGARLICQVQSMRHVDEALDVDAAVIVAQGAEAGGHGARRATLPFVPEVADHLARRAPHTLLLAAGGIADGRGLAAALMLGADGVVVGTRFWASQEALTPQPMVERAIAASGDDTVRTTTVDALRGVDWPEEFSYRILRNRLTDAWTGREAEARAAFGSMREAYAKARASNDLDVVATIAGEAVGLIHDRPGAGSIVESMVAQATQQLAGADTYLAH